MSDYGVTIVDEPYVYTSERKHVAQLHQRWHAMRPHAIQDAFYHSPHRFNVVPAGRRSGKTEIAKRRLVKRAVRGSDWDRPRYFYGAPTYGQAKKIAWEDLKRMTPRDAMRWKSKSGTLNPWSESEMLIPLWHGGELFVVGLDQPARIEGAPIDGGTLDEYGNLKSTVWGENLRPALSDRDGWCDLIGVPEGRNHYFDRAEEAKAELAEHGLDSEWGYFHWVSADILPAKEIAAARRDLDELTFQQEYEASFVNFTGRTYYAFTDANKVRCRDRYNPKAPLIFMLDFNVAPGVAAVGQEMVLANGLKGTGIIGEVWIDSGSNTELVCRRLLNDWKHHTGLVFVYGDATGGAEGSAKTEGSDWDIAQKVLIKSGDPNNNVKPFGARAIFKYKNSNPRERARINAVNSRCKSTLGTIRMHVDPKHAPHVVKDFEGVRNVEGGSGEIDKKKDPKLTHISDAIGYYVEAEFPVTETGVWGTSQHTGP